MSLADELERLQALHDSGTLTDSEFADAKAKVLAENQPSATVASSGVQRDLRRLQIQNEILSLDQSWSDEREDYMLHGRYGSRSVPNESSSMSAAVFLCVLFLIVGIVGASISGGTPIVVMSVLGFLGGIWCGFYYSAKAGIYDAAYEQYQQERRDLTDQLEALNE